jgi:hypothetical protein
MRSMKFIFCFIILFYSAGIFAQDTTWTKNTDSNSVVIHKDSRLDLLVKKQAQINDESSRNAKRTAKGFRLLVINTNRRDDALAAKTKVYTYFPELKAYLIYQSPYFKLKVGNFKDRKEAEEYQQRLKNYFPNGVFIMNDIIEIKPGKNLEDELIQ